MNTEKKEMPETVTPKDVANAIGWLDVMADGDLEFSSADWPAVNETGRIYLEGRQGDLLVDVIVQIVEVNVQRDWDAAIGWDDLDDEED